MTDLTAWAKRGIEGRPVEATVTRKVIKALADADKPVTVVFDGAERTPVTDTNSILNEVFNLDEAFLLTADGSWVRLVMGNGYDIVCDYTTNLEEILAPTSEYCMARG